jgi:DHA1 family inner membrane transport protein
MRSAILALTISAFGIGTSEFVINGLLPEVSQDFAVSIPMAGLLISGFAAGIIVGAPLLTILTLRLPRKAVLQGALLIFVAGSALSAAAYDYWTLMAGRVLSAIAVGAFYGVGSVVAASLVAPDSRASAIALMFAGATAATVFGVPLGTLIGQELGWRATYWIVTAIGLLGLLGVTALVPKVKTNAPSRLSNEFAVFKRTQVWLALAMTACSFGAIAAVFTYIAPLLRDVTGFSDKAVTVLLFVIGVGLFAGNLIGGKLADRKLMPSMIGLFAMFTVVLAALAFTVHNQIAAAITLFLFGVAGYGLVPGAQIRVVDKAEGAPTIASAMNISAFNVGVTAGAALGGAAIDAGFGLTSIAWVGAAISAGGLGLAVISYSLDQTMDRQVACTHEVVGRRLSAWAGRAEPRSRRDRERVE